MKSSREGRQSEHAAFNSMNILEFGALHKGTLEQFWHVLLLLLYNKI